MKTPFGMQKLEFFSSLFAVWIICYTVGWIAAEVWHHDGSVAPSIMAIFGGFALFVVGVVYLACSVARFMYVHGVKK